MPRISLPPDFRDDVIQTSRGTPLLANRHTVDLANKRNPPPVPLENPHGYSRAVSRATREIVDDLVRKGELGWVEANLGKIFPVTGPFFRSSEALPMDASVVNRLAQRPVDKPLNDTTRIYYSRRFSPVLSGSEEQLRTFFRYASFIQNKAMGQFTSIYTYLFQKEPEIARTYRYVPHTVRQLVCFDDIMSEFDGRADFGRHWVPHAPETGSGVYIDRGAGPVRVLFFVRPVPRQALLRIQERFHKAGQAFELW